MKKCPTERPADRGISRPAGREQLADCGSSSVITFWTLSKFQNISKSAVRRDAPMKVSRLAGPERLADCGSSSVITFWTLSKFQTISKSVVGRDSPIGVSLERQLENDSPIRVSLDRRVEKGLHTRVSLLALSREPSADEGFLTVMTSWTLNIFQSPQWDETRP